MSFQLTKNEILKEILKSGKDPTYFITNYAKIAHPLEGLLPFKLYDFQEDLVKNFNDHRFNCGNCCFRYISSKSGSRIKN